MDGREEPLSRLEAIVLGLLIERPAHGYDLKARLGPGLPRERLVNDGVLYPLLARLERRGLAGVDLRQANGRSRKVYSALKPGKDAFEAWLAGDRDEGATVDYEMFIDHPMVKLLFASRMTAAQLEEKVTGLLDAARIRLEALGRVPRLEAPGPGAGVGQAILAVGRARELALIEQLEGIRADLPSAPRG